MADNPIQWFEAEITMRRVLRIMVPADILRSGETHEEVAAELAERGGADHPDFTQIIKEEWETDTLNAIPAPTSQQEGR